LNYGYEPYVFAAFSILIGDITLVPDVSVELVVNSIEGYNYSFKFKPT